MVDCYPDIPGPYFMRIYVHVIRASNCTGGQEDATVRAAVEQMREDFAPYSIYFVWDDCLIECIGDDDLYTLQGLYLFDNPPSGAVGLTTLEADYGHGDGIDIFIFPEDNGYGPPGAATTPGGTLAIGGLVNLTSGEIFNPLEHHILSHEMGHCLGLHHTFRATACDPCEYANGDNGCLCGDVVKDTPPHPGDGVNSLLNNTSYPQCHYALSGSDCSQPPVPYNPDEHNIMNYSYPPCLAYFSVGQGARARYVIAQNSTNIDAVLYPVIANNVFNDVVITPASDPVWDLTDFPSGKVTIYQSLVIEGGAQLSIEAGLTVRFGPNAAAIVKPNGLLELNGTLTGLCGAPWKGIAVWGDCYKSQTPVNGVYAQGRFVGKARGIVERAETAARLYGPTIAESGGQISCTGTTFRNNRVAVDFARFNNKPLTVPQTNCFSGNLDYKGFFNGCRFETNDDYPLTLQPFESFIKMTGVRGVRIFSPTFVNTKADNNCNATNNDNCHGYGIKAFQSGFQVAKYLLGGAAPEFKGLSYGVHSVESSLKPVTITSANFRDCYKGIYAEQAIAINIGLNKFYLGHLPDPAVSDRQFGTILYKSTAFKYYDNRFFGPAGNVEKIVGTCTYESGDKNNVVLRNKYDGIAIGNVANGTNGGFELGIPRGLQYQCNDNTNNYGFDFSLPTGGDIIRQRQGEFVNNINRATGNKFSYNPAVDESDFSNYGGQSIDYYYLPNTLGGSEEEPLDYFNLAKFIGGVNPDCNVGIEVPLPPLAGTDLQNEKNRYYSERAGYLQEKSAYLAALQSGNQTAAAQHAERAAQHRFEMDQSAREVLQSLVRDTLTDQRDSARQWLLNIETFEADLFLVLDYLDNGEATQAQSAYNAIPGRFTLTADQQQDYSNFGTIVSVLSAQSMYELDNSAQQSLLGVAQQPKGFSVQTAKGILQLYGYAFASPECSLPECCGALERGANGSIWESQKNLAIDLNVWPNPARDEVFFELKIADGSQNAVIKVWDIVGKLIWSQEVFGESRTSWPAAKNAEGLYFYTIEIDGKPIKSGKISLIK